MSSGMTSREVTTPMASTIESGMPVSARWYAAYTCARHEKRVREQLEERHIRCFLPLYSSVRSWKDRQKELEDDEIELLLSGVANGARVEPHPYLKLGRRVRVRSGPLAGTEGILVRKKERLRVVVSIDLIMRSVAVEVDAADLE